MTDDGTARVRAYEADKERINDLRQGGETQADVIRRLLEDDVPAEVSTPLADVPEDFGSETPPGYEDVNAGITEILDALDRIEDAATTAEERTGSIERAVEDLGGR